MDTIKCVVVDDDYQSIEIIKKYASDLSDIQICEDYTDPIKALMNLDYNNTMAIFLDIDMPKINGIEFVENMQEDIPIVFTTAHTEYAMQSYELNVLDYLVKPYSFVRFVKTIHKIKENISDKHIDNQEYTFVKCDKKMIKIFFDDILFIEGLKDYIKIHTFSQKLVIHNALASFHELLPQKKFIRIHKSYIVSADKIQVVNGNIVEINEHKVPVGRSYALTLKSIINKK